MEERTITLNLIREIAPVRVSPRVRQICWDFGVPPREPPLTIAEELSVPMGPGRIVLLSGPSGAGKSSLLAAIAEQCPRAVWVGAARTSSARTVVDGVAPRGSLPQALQILTACGLGEPRLWIRRYEDLSDGERFRATLARAIGRAMHEHAAPIFCDEFTAILHRRAARAIAYNLRKLVTRAGLTLVVATTHEDICDDLQADVTVRLDGHAARVETRSTDSRPFTLRRRACIEAGSVRDYATFAPMHYRHRDGLGFVDQVFLLRERPGGPPLGIAVFAMAPIELSLRNQATVGRFTRNPRRLNRELRILRRLVMHPDVRGCGLGHWFVRNTLPRVRTRFVECLAAMGAVNPVFERAGMTCIGRVPRPRGRQALLDRMAQWRVDPFSPRFHQTMRRCPRVRRLVEQTILDWKRATSGGGSDPLAGRSHSELAVTFRQLVGEPPMYYLWDRQSEFPRHDPSAGSASREVQTGRTTRRTRNAPGNESVRRRGMDRHDPMTRGQTKNGDKDEAR